MPSLADSLAQLAQQSDQITVLAAQNARPSGPYVQALLHTPSVLQLIRDAHDSETRLFKFIGEESSGAKKVEKRDGTLVTPLKEMKRGKQERDQVGTMLRTATKLVDDYHPMPRARAHIQNLLDAHQRQVDRVAELERLIEQATSGSSEPPAAPDAAPQRQKPALTVDQAIQAEERALRELESSLSALRSSQPSRPADNFAPTPAPRSPSPPPRPFSQTPAKTPNAMPHIANSLVNGTTPRRPVQNTMNRFSPLRFLGTPRAPVGRSTLGQGDEEERRGTIFDGLGRGTYQQSVLTTPAPESAAEDETVRFAPLLNPSPEKPSVPETPGPPDAPDASAVDVSADVTPKASPVKAAPSPAPVELQASVGARKSHNVDIRSDVVKAGTDKIWSTMPEMMRQGVKDGKLVGQDAESTVDHIYHLSQSDPPAPPSPSSASSLSALANVQSKAPPITNQTILIAYLLLLLLQSPDGSVTVHDLKESLGTLARARGWEGGEGLATKVLYLAVGRRVVRIDRRGGGGGKVSFAL